MTRLLHGLDGLLACHSLLGTLTGTSIGASALPPSRQTTTVAQTSVTSDIAKAVDGCSVGSSQYTLCQEVTFSVSGNGCQLFVRKFFGATVFVEAEILANPVRGGIPNTKQVSKRNDGALIVGDVDSDETWQDLFLI